ncbi:MtrAB system accessory lipoprotein LpqB [Aldersonia sp. NBC_00410]|uniref:MtrAB system accessory lipoprotein LpqB n=1 Tax=Aldersonia sp. NBC_00410 TaxID=2975954 RepID=UPI002254A7C4|nr:MtrAB system accessory lipoprotein LpqB [Aldersonia sp. NBC_00410]MCX5044548.1 MtrAB system accessory lipoprotein LpqB [Aldersonia sp. NBC_00410]
MSAGVIRMLRFAVCLVVGATVVSACASLPDTSTPEAIGTIDRVPASQSQPEPSPGREPDLLIRDFFKASTAPAERHRAARQFLTASASQQWDDAASATIVDKVDVLPESRTADRATYLIRANRTGQLQPGGAYQAEDGTFETKVSLARNDGDWRIDNLPAGVIMDRSQFLNAYQRKSLYFVDPTGTSTVPDPRWISSGREQHATELIGLLIQGAAPALAPAVRNELEKVSIRGPITKADGRTSSVGVGLGGIRVDFAGVDRLDRQARELLAAQVVWTLANAEISGPYVLLADGNPLDGRYADGWTTADVAALNPVAGDSTDSGLHAVSDGVLVDVNDTGVVPAPGYFGTVNNMRTAALSRDGNYVAAVVDSGRPAPASALMVGSYGGGAFPVAEGGTITRPSWAADDGSAWAVLDGTRVVRAVRDRDTGQVSLNDVDASAVNGLGPISELRLSRDGVRAAMIVDGKVYVAVVVPQPNGAPALRSPQLIAVGLGSPALSLDWSTSEMLVVARATPDTPVAMVAVDGSRFDTLPGRNLTAPVSSVDASAMIEYVADARAVFQLNNNDPETDRYWREVPGLSGRRAVPVLPG